VSVYVVIWAMKFQPITLFRDIAFLWGRILIYLAVKLFIYKLLHNITSIKKIS